MIIPELLTTKMLQDLQHGAPIDTCGGHLLFADCQAVLDLYAKGNARAEDKAGIRAAKQRICDHLNTKIFDEALADSHVRQILGDCTVAALEKALESMRPQDMVTYAMGTLSNAQRLIHRNPDGSWHIRDADANTIRQLINIAKYAMDKAVPR